MHGIRDYTSRLDNPEIVAQVNDEFQRKNFYNHGYKYINDRFIDNDFDIGR